MSNPAAPARFDWRTPTFEAYIFSNVLKSKPAQWNFNKINRSAPFRIGAINAWIKEGGKTYFHTRLTIAVAILPFVKGASKPSIRKLEELKRKTISAEIDKKQ